MSQRILLIANPTSGSPWRGREQAQAVMELALEAEVDLRLTERAGHATQIARETELVGYDAICVQGGDGTLHEVVSGLLQRREPANIPLGLIPSGTGNSVARSLGLTSPGESVRCIEAGQTRPLDVIRVAAGGETHYCLNLIGWAAGQAITATAERLRWLGSRRYAAAALAHVLRARPQRARISIDSTVLEDEFLLVLASNTKYVGSGMLAAPRAEIDDGLMDLVLVRRASRWRMLELLRRVHDGSHLEMAEVEYHQARCLAIETPSPEPLNLDGELKGQTPLAAEVLPGAIRVFA
jgi:diacylglycerol kinase (ATP)